VNFSVSLIARNEAKTLPRLMKSLAEFQRRGGEVVLLDTGSTDGTPALARKLGCKVEEVGEKYIFEISADLAEKINATFLVTGEESIVRAGDKLFDYAAARNHSASLASTDYISVVDCDEFFTTLNLDAIEAEIKNGWEQIEHHFIFNRAPNGQPAIQFTCCRFYDRRKLKWQGVVHETLTGAATRTYLGSDIIELEHCQDQAAAPRRSRYLAGLALDCYQHQDNDRNSHYFGRELLWTGRPKSAIKELTRHVAMNRWVQEKAQSLIYIGDAYAQMGDEARALEHYNLSFVTDGTRREPLIRLAEYFWRKNDPQKVACYVASALEIPLNDCYCNLGAHYMNLPHELMYWALWYLGRRAEAKEHWEKALAYEPSNPKYLSDKQFFCPEPDKIPKRIFTIWLNDDPVLPEIVTQCVESQKIPGYEHKILTLADCPKGIPYLDAALAAKKWVKASDYLRLHELYERGGIYCDADTEILPGKNFDDMLSFTLFTGSEDSKYVMNGTLGAIPKHPVIKQCLDELTSKFQGDDEHVFEAAQQLLTPLVYHASDYPDVKVFSPEYFCPYNHARGTINVTANTRTFHHFAKSWLKEGEHFDVLPKVAILLPTLNRPEGFKRCLASIQQLHYPKHLLKVYSDDGAETVPVKVSKLYQQAKLDNCTDFVFAADDTEFEPYSLYRAVQAALQHGLVAFNTGELTPDKGNICEHFLIRDDVVSKIGGEIFSTKFHHCGCDNLLWAKCDKLGEATRCEDAVVKHYHFSRGGKMDATYELGWSQVKQDRAILAEELQKLNTSM